MKVEAGDRFGPYTLVSLLGSGGMGEVWQAEDSRLGRTVAIKILPADVATDEDRRARFEREARVLSRLQHPNVCTLHDIGEHDGRRYLVMERLEERRRGSGSGAGPSAVTTCCASALRSPTVSMPPIARDWCIATSSPAT